MQISVVIPSYNRLPSLIRAIESVLDQSDPVDEIIVVDDGSNDGTAAHIAQNYGQIKLIHQSNRGVSAARNVGIRHASYAWIAFLDSDDSWQAQKILQIRNAYRQNPEFRLFHSDEIWIRNGRRVNAMNKHRKSGGWIFERCLPLCVISPSAVVLQSSLLEESGCFDESLPACEDYDLWLKICHQYPVYYIDQMLITKYGGHADQLSTQYWGMDRFRIRALHHLVTRNCLIQAYRQAAVTTLVDKLEVLLSGARKHGNQAVIDEFQPLLKTWLEDASNTEASIRC